MGGANVTVKKFPGTKKVVQLTDGDTVSQVLKRAEVDATGFDVRIKGEKVDGDHVVKSTDELVLVKKIESAA